MADFYSEHYAAVVTAGVSPTSIDDPLAFVAAGINHGKLHYKRGSVWTTTATAAADILRFFRLKSSDRILELVLNHEADASTSATGDVGLYTAGGAVIDLDLFCDVGDVPMSDITAAMVRANLFATATSALDNEDRGKRLWELANEGAATLTEDPLVDYDICMTVAAEVGIVATEYVMECIYVPGTTA